MKKGTLVYFGRDDEGFVVSELFLNPDHVNCDGLLQSAHVTFFYETGASNYRQLADGRFVGMLCNMYYTTLQKFFPWETPEFNSEAFTPSTKIEVEEYKKLV